MVVEPPHHHRGNHPHHHVEVDGSGGRGQNLDLHRHQALAWPQALWQTSSTDDHPYHHCHHPLQLMTIRIVIVVILHRARPQLSHELEFYNYT